MDGDGLHVQGPTHIMNHDDDDDDDGHMSMLVSTCYQILKEGKRGNHGHEQCRWSLAICVVLYMDKKLNNVCHQESTL